VKCTTTKFTYEGKDAKLTSCYLIIIKATQEMKPDVMKNKQQQEQPV
jgi:hypothetical protein